MRGRGWVQAAGAVLVLVFALGCASPQWPGPEARPEAIADARDALTAEALRAGLERRRRVLDLAFRLYTENADLCPAPQPVAGLLLADRKGLGDLAGGLRDEDLARIGIEDGVRVVHAAKGGPAALASLGAGTELLRVGEERVTTAKAASRQIAAALRESGDVALTVGAADGEQTLRLTGVKACPYRVLLSTSPSLNASAAGGKAIIHWGAIDALDDAALHFLLAHETAHLIARHPRRYARNLLVSGGAVALPVLYAAASLGDEAGAAFGYHPDTPLRARALGFTLPYAADFEAEADYLGLYLFARSGGDVAAARGLFEAIGRVSPASHYLRATHPPLAERIAAIEAARAEIEAKREASLELVPERRP